MLILYNINVMKCMEIAIVSFFRSIFLFMTLLCIYKQYLNPKA